MSIVDMNGRVRWYVLRTKRNQEARAVSNLRRWGIPTLAPKIREFRGSSSSSGRSRIAALFPSYVFAQFEAETLLAKVRLTRGISDVVGFGEAATAVDDAIIALIQGRLDEEDFVRLPELKAGDPVEIVDGPLRSLAGVFERTVSASDRIVIMLTTLGGQTRVQVAKAAVRMGQPPVSGAGSGGPDIHQRLH
jgi:transcriptional antiterminator RfaH